MAPYTEQLDRQHFRFAVILFELIAYVVRKHAQTERFISFVLLCLHSITHKNTQFDDLFPGLLYFKCYTFIE